MESDGIFETVLGSFEQFYDVRRDAVPPFAAEAEFRSHNEQYFLVKSAKVADIDSNEFVFFAREARLSLGRLLELDAAAWAEGLSRVRPYYGHRNTDVSLIIMADTIDGDAMRAVRKMRHYKSYMLSLYGWSSFRILAYEISSRKCASNRRGSDLKKLVCSI